MRVLRQTQRATNVVRTVTCNSCCKREESRINWTQPQLVEVTGHEEWERRGSGVGMEMGPRETTGCAGQHWLGLGSWPATETGRQGPSPGIGWSNQFFCQLEFSQVGTWMGARVVLGMRP